MKKIIAYLVIVTVIATGYYLYTIKTTIEPSALQDSFDSPPCPPGYITNDQHTGCTLKEQSSDLNSWKTGGDEGISFKYPSTWTMREIPEPRPGSVYNAGFWIIPPGDPATSSTNTSNAIVIVTHGYGDTCGQSMDLTRCKNVKSGVTVVTRSDDKTVLAIYDRLVQTIK